MATLALNRVTAGTLIESSDENANQVLEESVVNDLDRNNVSTQWTTFCIPARVYVAAAAGTTIDVDCQIPVWNGTSAIRYQGVSYHKVATTATRTIQVDRYELATPANIVNLQPSATLAIGVVRAGVDGTVAQIVPSTHGLRVTYAVTAGTFDAGEWINVWVWVAVQIAKLTEL